MKIYLSQFLRRFFLEDGGMKWSSIILSTCILVGGVSPSFALVCGDPAGCVVRVQYIKYHPGSFTVGENILVNWDNTCAPAEYGTTEHSLDAPNGYYSMSNSKYYWDGVKWKLAFPLLHTVCRTKGCNPADIQIDLTHSSAVGIETLLPGGCIDFDLSDSANPDPGACPNKKSLISLSD